MFNYHPTIVSLAVAVHLLSFCNKLKQHCIVTALSIFFFYLYSMVEIVHHRTNAMHEMKLHK